MGFITEQTAKFIEDVGRIHTIDEFMLLLQALLPQFGIRHFTLGELNPADADAFAGTFPEDWTKRYLEKKYVFRDPVHLRLFRQREGFYWDEARLKGERLLTAQTVPVFHEGCDFGLLRGYTHIIPSLDGNVAIASFAGVEVEREPTTLPALHLISLYMHAKFKELTQKPLVPNDELLSLTRREIECLQWAGSGKTDWEIAQILSIKETTVHSHIENAKRKLNVGTRIQAVLRSLRCGLIQL